MVITDYDNSDDNCTIVDRQDNEDLLWIRPRQLGPAVDPAWFTGVDPRILPAWLSCLVLLIYRVWTPCIDAGASHRGTCGKDGVGGLQ